MTGKRNYRLEGTGTWVQGLTRKVREQWTHLIRKDGAGTQLHSRKA